MEESSQPRHSTTTRRLLRSPKRPQKNLLKSPRSPRKLSPSKRKNTKKRRSHLSSEDSKRNLLQTKNDK
jgi:hypothetical protein